MKKPLKYKPISTRRHRKLLDDEEDLREFRKSYWDKCAANRALKNGLEAATKRADRAINFIERIRNEYGFHEIVGGRIRISYDKLLDALGPQQTAELGEIIEERLCKPTAPDTAADAPNSPPPPRAG